MQGKNLNTKTNLSFKMLLYLKLYIVSLSCTITEYAVLEGTHKDHKVQCFPPIILTGILPVK